MTPAIEKILPGISDSLAEIADTLVSEAELSAETRALAQEQLKELIAAIGGIKFEAKAAEVKVTVPPSAVTVNVPKAEPVVNVEAAKSWSEIKVTPHRDTRTGEVTAYTIKRVS